MPQKLTFGTESIPARLKVLGFKSYREYLQSEHWREFKARLFKTSRICRRIRKKYGEMRCYFCAGRGPLNVHHKTYKHLGAEHLDDVFVLCEPCHERVHEKQKETGKNLWRVSQRVKRETWKRRTRGWERKRRAKREFAQPVEKSVGNPRPIKIVKKRETDTN